jgi:hypothetical protein
MISINNEHRIPQIQTFCLVLFKWGFVTSALTIVASLLVCWWKSSLVLVQSRRGELQLTFLLKH